jgi:hypothetical protein
MGQSSGGDGSGSPGADRDAQSAASGPEFPAGRREETAPGPSGGYRVTRSLSADPATPSHPPTEAASPHPATELASPYPPTESGGQGSGAPAGFSADRDGLASDTVSTGGPAGIVRLGPGVPVSSPAGRAGPTAEQVWRTGQLPAPPRRRRRLRRMASGAVTVVLLAAAGVVLFLRFHHAPLRVTGVAIAGQVTTGCAVDVTGRIGTNGSAGTISYQWLLTPQSQAPQPMSQSVVAGQDAVYVMVDVQGQAGGSAAREVTLQVLGPGSGTASAHVVVSC